MSADTGPVGPVGPAGRWPVVGDPAEVVAPGVTRADAIMLANHAIYVQGGYSDPHREAERASADYDRAVDADGVEAFKANLERMSYEVTSALTARFADRRGTTTVLTDVADPAPPAAGADEFDAAAPTDDQAPPPGEPPADDGPAGIPLDLVRKYTRLRELEKSSDAERAAYKEEANAIEGQLVDIFAEAGMQNVNLDGKTVFLKRTTFAQRKAGVTTEDVKAALVASGAAELVTETVNSQTLSAWVRELLEGDDAPGLPEPAAEILELGERFSININASRGKRK